MYFYYQAVLVKIASYYVRSLPNYIELNVYKKTSNVKEEGTFKKESNDTSTCNSSNDSPKVAKSDHPDNEASIFAKLNEVYTMGESWFGSAFVLQVPIVYLCLHKSQMPSFMESHIYKEMQTTGEALLNNMLNREEKVACKTARSNNSAGPFAKRRKLRHRLSSTTAQQTAPYDIGVDISFDDMTFESLLGGEPQTLDDSVYKKTSSQLYGSTSLADVFTSYKPIVPRTEQLVSLNISRCNVWDRTRLKLPKFLLPKASEHVHKPLLINYYKSKPIVNRMPHCKFSRPLQPKLKTGYTLHHIIL